MIEPTYAKAQELRKRLMLSSSVLGVDGYTMLSSEVDKLTAMAAIRDAEKWAEHYREGLQQKPVNEKSLAKYAFWTQNACQMALKTISSELLRDVKEMVSKREVRYNINVAKHPDLLMARTKEILCILEEDGSYFSEEGALMIMTAYVHLGVLLQIHSG